MNYNAERNIGYILMVDLDFPVYLLPLRSDLSEKRAINVVKKLVCSFLR